MEWMLREWLLFKVAVQFLTRIPVPSFPHFDVAWLSQSLRWFPVVGACIAILQCVLWFGLVTVLPHAVALALVMGVGLLLTGGFHEDGWADVCDGMGGARDPARVLVIMKDSRVGAFGAMGLTWMLLSKWTVLGYLGGPAVFVFALLCGHVLSRLAATALIVALDHVGDAEHSKTKPLGNQMSRSQWFVSAGLAMGVLLPVTLGCAVWSNGFAGSVGRFVLALAGASAVAALVAVVCAAWFRRRIGGYTGDCLGATQQLSELMIYASVLAVLQPARWA